MRFLCRSHAPWSGLVVVPLIGALLGYSRLAEAQDTKKAECAAAYEKSQELRASGKLQSARENLVVCAQDICPSFVQTDCAQWLTEVQREMPTVVIAAKDQRGEDTVAVRVISDGQEVLKELDGKAMPIDPGAHKLRFELDGAAAIEQQVVIRQGQKDRVVFVSFAPNAADVPVDDPYAGAAKSDETKDEGANNGKPGPLRPFAYAAGGVGAAGILGFVVFGALGHGAKSDLDSSGCKPNCSQDKVDAIKTKYLLADISLGVGIAGLGTGVALFFLSRPKHDAPPEDHGASVKFDVHAAPGVTYASLTGAF